MKLSQSPGFLDRGGPSFGEANDYVLAEICGYTRDEIERLIAQKVVQPMSRPGEVRLERRYWPRMRDVMPELPWPNGEKPS